MGILPELTSGDVESIIPNCQVIGPKLNGGQKIVFPCSISGEKCAIKFILVNDLKKQTNSVSSTKMEEIRGRAEREIAIMHEVNSTHIVKMGVVDLTSVTYNDQEILYYSEEWIDGTDLLTLLRNKGRLKALSVIKLGLNITDAISALWNTNNVHRDIKPQNIIQRSSNGEFVLLDLGLAFDLDDKSLTQFGFVPGTRMYLSPEQLDVSKKRDIDFRSDLFSLGIVMYFMITGIHPFYQNGMTDSELFSKIINEPIIPPAILDSAIPKNVSDIICRLLNKQPSERFRKCSILERELNTILKGLEV